MNDGIAEAKRELESYMDTLKAASYLWRRYANLIARQGSVTSGAPQVGKRPGYRYEKVKDEKGNPTGKKKRVPDLIPCPISVQTQRNPHREEDLHAEISALMYEYTQKIERSRVIAAKIETRIMAMSTGSSEILYMRYIEGLRPDQIVLRENWFYSYRQIIRKIEAATEEYARIWGFIKKS